MVHKKADVEGEHDDAQLTFLVLGGITMTGAIAWMKPKLVAEQWRVWVFLLLNLVLMAIVFSSTKNNADNKKVHKMVMSTGTKCDQSPSDNGMDTELQLRTEEEQEDDGRGYMLDGDGNGDDELNERVEAFIVMFRQHLVADAKITSRGK